MIRGALGCLALLLAGGAAIRLTHDRQVRELHLVLACRRGDANEVHELLTAGVDPNAVVRVDDSPIAWWYHELLARKDLKVMRLPAIFEASLRNRLDIVDDLLAHGANPDFGVASGRTALVNAVENRNLGMVRHLLDHHATPKLVYKDGTISLDEALAEMTKQPG
ncbi:MAG TPA: ankyrin repeat domain-containing protein [Fimbriimonadaceae bacterium]|nr:ankyrin repeat domain-containing protein [Fimbriimonadaceae bacterium]